MGHDHSSAHEVHAKTFGIGVALNVIYVVIEVVAGFMVGSLALLADAGHNLSDVVGLLIAWGAAILSSIQPSERHTYGFRSSSILAAIANGLILLLAVGGITWEAIHRFWEPQQVGGTAVMFVAGVGVVVNGLTTLLFLKGRRHDLNIRGAFLHMAADTLVSLGVVLAGLGILLSGKNWIDPATSLVVAGVILWSTWDLLKDSVHLALQAVPAHIDPAAVQAYLQGLPGVAEVHDLHIWAMSTSENALTVHLVKPEVENEDDLLARICHDLHERFDIEHATVQIERSQEGRCAQASPGSI